MPFLKLWILPFVEMNTLNKMQCWDIVDASTMPEDAELIATKWVLKLKFENGKYIRHKAASQVT